MIELNQIRLQEKADEAINRSRNSKEVAHASANPDDEKTAQTIQDFWRIHVKYQGTDTPLLLSLPNNLDMNWVAKEFHKLHQKTFGFSDTARPLILEALQLERVASNTNNLNNQNIVSTVTEKNTLTPIAHSNMSCQLNGSVKPFTVPVYRREQLPKSIDIVGPALIAENNSTIVIEPNWIGRVIESGALILTHLDNAQTLQSQSENTTQSQEATHGERTLNEQSQDEQTAEDEVESAPDAIQLLSLIHI